MVSKTTKSYLHCPEEDYEINKFICNGRQKVHYPKCSECEFRTKFDKASPILLHKETEKPPPHKETEEPPPAPPRQTKTGSIMVNSKPPSADIYIDGDNIGVTPAILTQILPGRFKVMIKMDGYDPWNQSVAVVANRETSLTAVLQEKDGSIVIESRPANAAIFIDGNSAGETPKAINNVKAGKHLIELKLDEYETWSEEIIVEAEKETPLTAELTTIYGSISLGSEPTEAIIFLNGTEIGVTPADLRAVPPGTHLLEVRMEGYNVWKKSVIIEPGKEMVFTAMLHVETGSVNIKSQPKNAKIFLDGKDVGCAPERITLITPGTHEIKVKMDDYDVWSETVNIEAGKESEITAVLQRTTGSLMVESTPANAMIFFDGKKIGATPEIIISSVKGAHTVEIRKEGYGNWKKNVDIEPGAEKSLTATLHVKAGSLNIKSKPTGGTIFLDGEEAGPTPKTITDLVPGTHKVEIKMNKYEIWSESIDIEHSKETSLTAELQQLPGSLNIESEPVGAMVSINGEEAGSTPEIIAELTPGAHMVEVKMDEYETWSESVEVNADKENYVKAILRPLTGSVYIQSEPTDAIIIVEGEEVGNTPAIMTDLKPGKYLLEVRMEGYKNWSESVDIEHSKESTLTAVLQQLPGSLNIKSKPAGAMIFINDEEAGHTPKTITGLVSGTHMVEVRMEGYENWNESVDIEPGKEATSTAVLQRFTGSLYIKSEPAGAMIFINYAKAGHTPKTITGLVPDTHMVEVKIDGHENWKENVNIEPGKETALTAILQPDSLSICSKPSDTAISIDSKEVCATPLTIGSINIDSNPSDATIRIDGKNTGKTPAIITDLSPGTHLVEVKINGYEPWSESVEVRGNKESRLTAKLQEITGSINIKNSPSEATIYLDGEEIGATPDALKSVDIGSHEIEIKMEGYAEWNRTLNVKKGKEITLNAVLLPNTGTINLESEPAEAMILLDGKKVGKTPVNLTGIKIGMHEVEIQKDGYVTWKKMIKIKAGRVNAMAAKLLVKKGSVTVNSKPSNGIIRIDGKKAGITPAVITDLSAGKHMVEVRMEEYEIWCDSVDIDPEKEIAVTAELQMKSGAVCIKSNPSEATILIDNEKVGTTPKIVANLSAKEHIVEVRMDGYKDWSESIDIKPGIEIGVTAELQIRAGSVSINSEPSNAIIFIDNIRAGSTPETLTDIKSGKHLVEVRKEGYETWTENVDVRGDKENVLAVALNKITGTIIIKSNHSEAIIYLDGKEVGATPDNIKFVTIGTHDVEVKMKGYATWKKALNMKKGKEIALDVVLQPVTSIVSLESEPTGSIILLDGENIGKTPKTITDIETGKHEVEIRMDEYVPWKKRIKIKAGREYAFTAELQTKSGSLLIISSPSNAMIYIQDKKMGITPRTIPELKPGIYTVEVKLNDYQAWSEKVDIVPGKETTLKPRLQAKPGSIIIKSNPSEAKLLIDGKDAGTTPKTINDVEDGTHIVELKMEGYESWSENVEVRANKESNITAVLQVITGSISIKSEPANATIFVNDNKIGPAPETITNLKPGKYQVEVRKDGFENWNNSVEVTAGKESDLKATLQTDVGSVSIKSNPSNAVVILDGKEVGVTPATLSSIPIGAHEIKITIDGHEEWKKSITIKKEKETSLNAVLQLNIGSISVESYPENAKINLDGKDVGMAPKLLTDIIVGTHEVEVLLDGYVTWKRTIKVKAEKEVSLTADLEKVGDTLETKADNTMKAPEIPKPITHETHEPEFKQEKDEEKTITQPQEPEPSFISKETRVLPDELIKLRSTYDKISESQIDSLPFITVREKNNSIFLCHSLINHRYELKPIGNGEVIIDHTSKLMWYQSGSPEYSNLKKANKWLKKTNKNCYAGFNDWRLPTLEEASSLLEFEAKNGSFIDSIFDNKQWGTWTGDKSDRGLVWIVAFVNGTINQAQVGTPATFVKPVRSLNR